MAERIVSFKRLYMYFTYGCGFEVMFYKDMVISAHLDVSLNSQRKLACANDYSG